jgi:hypothetical protein
MKAVAYFYPRGAGFNSIPSNAGFFPHLKEVEDIGLVINQPCKRSKTCLVILKGAVLTGCASFAFAT